MSLPGAAELFRPTDPAGPAPDTAAAAAAAGDSPEVGAGSGRVRHEEKITVYVSRSELLALEQARLTLRAEHATAVDRGRIVRVAIAALLDDLGQQGPDSELVRRLTAS